MKPAILLPLRARVAGAFLFFAGTATAQTPPPPAPDAPAATVPSSTPPEANEAVVAEPAEPPPADLPPPPPPRSSGEPPPAEGRVVIDVPPPPVAVPRAGQYVHDGFYLRMALGVGAGRISMSTDRESSPNYSIGGAALGLNLWIGGTPWSGVAVGGLISVNSIESDELSVDDREYDMDSKSSLVLVGAFVDAFPDPQRGLHFGGALGLAETRIDPSEQSLEDFNAGGAGLSAWIGYGGWVGTEWTLGGMLQLTGVFTRKESDGVVQQANAGALTLSLTAAYH